MKRFFIPLLSLMSSAMIGQDWSLSLSSNVELRTWKLSNKADKEEKGLVGASIKLFKGAEMINEVSSSGNGDFKITVPGNGEFTLEVAYPGCNTKKFAISTLGVPEATSKDNFKPSYSIGGFVMAWPLPGIDYTYLSQPLVKVVYNTRGQKFDDDGSTTDRSLKALSRIAESENKLIEKFCQTNREGDAALMKPDCPLAKTLYDKALTLIPREAYPTQQLTKVDKCLKDKEAADKKAAELAAAPKTATTAADTKDADKKAVEDAVAKAKADKAAKDQALNDQLLKGASDQAQKKAASEKAANAAAEKSQPAASAQQPTTTATGKKPPIKVIEKSDKETEAEKRKAGLAKSQAEDAAAMKADADKAEAKRVEKEKKSNEASTKAKTEQQKKLEEKQAQDKEDAKKEAEQRAAKAEENRKKQQEAQAKDKEEAKKEAEEKAAKDKAAQEQRDKEDAEAAAKDKEGRQKFNDELEKDRAAGKVKADRSIPPVLGSNDSYKDKITKADNYLNNKRYKEAKTEYEAALKMKPNDEYATSKLAEVNKLLTP